VATSFGNSSFGPRAKKTVASSRAPQAPTCSEEARARGPHSFAAKTPRRGPELRKPRASACCEDGPRASSFSPWGKPSAHGSAAPPNFAHEVRPSAAAQVRPSAAARASTHARRRPWPAPARLKLRPAAKRPVHGKRRQATSGENINSHGHPPGVFGLCYLVSTYMFMGSINENFQLRHQFYKSRSQHIGLQAKVSGKPRYLAWGARLQITGSIY